MHILIRNLNLTPKVKELSVPQARKETISASANETVEQLEVYLQESYYYRVAAIL